MPAGRGPAPARTSRPVTRAQVEPTAAEREPSGSPARCTRCRGSGRRLRSSARGRGRRSRSGSSRRTVISSDSCRARVEGRPVGPDVARSSPRCGRRGARGTGPDRRGGEHELVGHGARARGARSRRQADLQAEHPAELAQPDASTATVITRRQQRHEGQHHDQDGRLEHEHRERARSAPAARRTPAGTASPAGSRPAAAAARSGSRRHSPLRRTCRKPWFHRVRCLNSARSVGGRLLPGRELGARRRRRPARPRLDSRTPSSQSSARQSASQPPAAPAGPPDEDGVAAERDEPLAGVAGAGGW